MKLFTNSKKMLAVISGVGILVTASSAMAVPGGLGLVSVASLSEPVDDLAATDIEGPTGIPITGGINFVGIASLTDSDENPLTVPTTSTAKGIHFSGGMTLGGSSGSYSGVPNFTSVTFQDFTFSPGMSPSPVDDFWEFYVGDVDYEFHMTDVFPSWGPNSLTLNGVGSLEIAGFDDTDGYFSMTIQDGASTELSFSASSAAGRGGAVPEPATLLLLGTGLFGMGIFGRFKNELA